jgi:hypothetical protein
MMRRNPGPGRLGRTLGVVLTILSLVHTPLPQPAFHKIRHHDAPGEVFEFHDHLLRWHPGAGIASDVSVLHWHWFLPSLPDQDAGAGRTDDGPAVHAHTIDWQATTWDAGPSVASNANDSESLARLIARPLPCSFDGAPAYSASALALLPPHHRLSRLVSRAPSAPGVSLGTLLHRWDC